MKNLHLYQTQITHESRVERETKSLAESGFFSKIEIVGVWEDGLPTEEQLDKWRRVLRIKLSLKKSKLPGARLLYLFEWMFRVYWKYKSEQLNIIQAHSLMALLPAVALKYTCHAKLLYDPHELETEVAGSRGLRKLISKVLEKTLLGFADEVTVVGHEISKWYQNAYPRVFKKTPINVVRNIPPQIPNDPKRLNKLREELPIPSESLVFLYQGTFNQGRGLERVINAFSAQKKYHLVFIGGGPLDIIVQQACTMNSHFHSYPIMPLDQLKSYTASADAGISFDDCNCLNNLYALPNKFFEYLLAGTPVVVSEGTEKKRIIDEFNCGWVVGTSANELFDFLEQVSTDAISKKKQGAFQASKNIAWENEESVFIAAYERLLQGSHDLGPFPSDEPVKTS